MTKEPTKPPDPDNLMGQMWGPAPASDAIKPVTADARPAGLTTQKRPLAVSIISWILIVSSGWTLPFLPFSLNNPTIQQVLQATGVAPAAVLLLNLLGAVANVAAGVAMLKRRRWGRQLYLIATPAIALVGMILYHFRLLPLFLLGSVVYVVFLVLLTRRAVSDYFAGSVDAPSATSDVAVRDSAPAFGIRKRSASVLLLILGGCILTTWLMMILPLSGNLPALTIGSLVFAVLSSAFVVPGILLVGSPAVGHRPGDPSGLGWRAVRAHGGGASGRRDDRGSRSRSHAEADRRIRYPFWNLCGRRRLPVDPWTATARQEGEGGVPGIGQVGSRRVGGSRGRCRGGGHVPDLPGGAPADPERHRSRSRAAGPPGAGTTSRGASL